jgi:hypothetical protein
LCRSADKRPVSGPRTAPSFSATCNLTPNHIHLAPPCTRFNDFVSFVDNKPGSEVSRVHKRTWLWLHLQGYKCMTPPERVRPLATYEPLYEPSEVVSSRGQMAVLYLAPEMPTILCSPRWMYCLPVTSLTNVASSFGP